MFEFEQISLIKSKTKKNWTYVAKNDKIKLRDAWTQVAKSEKINQKLFKFVSQIR